MATVSLVALMLLPIGMIGAAVWFHLDQEKRLRELSRELGLEHLTDR